MPFLLTCKSPRQHHWLRQVSQSWSGAQSCCLDDLDDGDDDDVDNGDDDYDDGVGYDDLDDDDDDGAWL